MIEKNDFFGSQRELIPKLTESSGVVGIDNDPEITLIPNFNISRPQEDFFFRIEKLIALGKVIGIVDPDRFTGALQIMIKSDFRTKPVAVGLYVS